MNAPLPSTSTAARLNAVFAAALVTLVMLSGIDNLAASQGSSALAAQSAAKQAV